MANSMKVQKSLAHTIVFRRSHFTTPHITLDMENIHLIVHHKDPLCMMLNYARNFGNAAKQGLKRQLIGWRIILQIQILGIMYLNMP